MTSKEKAEVFKKAIEENFNQDEFLSKECVLEILQQIIDAGEWINCE